MAMRLSWMGVGQRMEVGSRCGCGTDEKLVELHAANPVAGAQRRLFVMILLLALVLYFGPVFLIGWGWVRWMRWPGRLSWSSALSFIGLALATLALLLEIGAVI